MEEAPQHKDIGLCPENYLGCRWYFVTVCTDDRVKYFRGKAFCDWVLRVLKEESAKQFFFVRAFCLMPDHLHLL
jgi:REP element-mobilizing transposase RayT